MGRMTSHSEVMLNRCRLAVQMISLTVLASIVSASVRADDILDPVSEVYAARVKSLRYHIVAGECAGALVGATLFPALNSTDLSPILVVAGASAGMMGLAFGVWELMQRRIEALTGYLELVAKREFRPVVESVNAEIKSAYPDYSHRVATPTDLARVFEEFHGSLQHQIESLPSDPKRAFVKLAAKRVAAPYLF